MFFDDIELSQDDLDEINKIELSCQRKRSFSATDNEEESLAVPRSRKRRRILSDSESDDEQCFSPARPSTSGALPNDVWSISTGNQPKIIPYTESPGLKPIQLRHLMANSDPQDFYSLLVLDTVFEDIVYQTNLFAEQIISKGGLKRVSRIHKWVPTDVKEIKKFFALILWMGLVRLPSLADYWSTDPMFRQDFAKKCPDSKQI
ncbi:unnamed protein product [Parnassius apollo]|uniref:(apollo) hypothetical protein n=1 Tax=Parnassius apollo TaxID=110799 RepID=A0A8S3X3U8_PARAO|nr:unnamed protein product [Parnassius apollo]